ncbi:hypothetical protein EIP86_003889 [Pleurotus ostreatoroseus]|nr:hypothetical protein EIP86_003889 [Pleurotus ostreatoroseus]
MHSLLAAASEKAPVSGNAHGSYLTMRSKNGLIFGVINVIGNFATVFQDQAAYLLGGLAWFAIPFMFSTTLGLSAVALRGDPAMRTLTPDDVSAGLPASAAAAALLGKSGAAALLIVLFLAVTSATSAELIAVALFAVVMGLLGLIFFYIGISMGWLYEFMGVVLGSAVVPIALCVTWKKANKWGCIGGAISGFFAGIIAWLVTTATLNDNSINVTTTGGDFEMLAGNLASIGVGGIVTCVTSYFWPEDFNFDITRAINAPHSNNDFEEKPIGSSPHGTPEMDEDKKRDSVSADVSSVTSAQPSEDTELDPAMLNKAFRFAAWSSVVLLVVMLLVIPLPLFFAQTVYGVRGLEAWVVIGMIWTFTSAFSVVLYPLWESRAALVLIAKGMMKDIFSGGSGRYIAPSTEASKA